MWTLTASLPYPIFQWYLGGKYLKNINISLHYLTKYSLFHAKLNHVQPFYAAVLSCLCCFPGRRSAGFLQPTWTRKAFNEALMSSALSNQITSCLLPSGGGFPLLSAAAPYGIHACFCWKQISQRIFVLPFLHFESRIFFSLSFLPLPNMSVWSVRRKPEMVSADLLEKPNRPELGLFGAEQSLRWSWICVKIDL